MAELFANGRIIDLVLALVALEAAALLIWRWRRGHGPSPAGLVGNLVSGASLMLAVRAALTGAHWTIVAAFLLGSLLGHVTDLWLRLREEPSEALGRRSVSGDAGTSTDTAAFTARQRPGMIST